MVNLFTILGKVWSSLISYLRPVQPKIKSGNDQTKELVNECEQVKKQLQQTNILLSIFLFHIFTKYKQINKQLNDTTTEKASLKQAVRELQQQSKTFEQERNKARKISTKLSFENTLLEQKIVQVNECEQVKKQLQQTNASLSIFLFQVFTECKQINKQLNDATTENESLKQAVRGLQQQSKTFEQERNEARKISTKLSLENRLLEQKVVQLESHKEVLIQELSGSLSGQDIEFISWEFLIQKVKEVTNQLDEEIAHNQSLIKTNKDLQQEKDFLTRELNQLEENNTRLSQNNSKLLDNINFLELELRQTLDRIKPLERVKDKLEQEQAQLERKVYELNKVESKLRHAKEQIEQLEEELKKIQQTKKSLEVELKQEKAKVTSVEQKTKDLEKVKNQLDAELKQEKAKVALFEQKNKSLEQVRNQLETALKQEKGRVATLETETNGLQKAPNEARSERENKIDKNGEFLSEVSQLNHTIKHLKEKIRQLENQPNIGFLEQRNKGSNCNCNQPEALDYPDLLELYNNLVYFVQESLSCSGVEKLDCWEKTEDFYIELISRLCFIDTILIIKIKLLEETSLILDENDTETLALSFSYLGKFLFWSNGEVRWELSSFFNSKL